MINTDPSRILVAGDTHSNFLWWREHVLPLARANGVAGIVQVGDLNFSDGEPGARFLDSLDQALEEHGLWCVFVDGNHENLDRLLALPLREDGLREVRPRILHAPRGHRWNWHDVEFLALGGATSIRTKKAIEGFNWWPQEQITEAEIAACIEGGRCDVLFSHDAPSAVPLGRQPSLDADPNRQALQTVVEATSPQALFHGHRHQAYRAMLAEPPTLVVGLDRDGENGNCVVLDIAGMARGADVNACIIAADSGPAVPRAADLTL